MGTTKQTKMTRGQKKLAAILQRMRAKQDEQKIKRDENLKHLPLAAKLAIKAAEMGDEELSSNKLVLERTKAAIKNKKELTISQLLGSPVKCRNITIDLAKGIKQETVCKKYGVSEEAIKEFIKDHLKPVAEQMVRGSLKGEMGNGERGSGTGEMGNGKGEVAAGGASNGEASNGQGEVGSARLKDLPVNSPQRLALMRPFMSEEELRIADQWEKDLQANGSFPVDIKDFHVFRSAYMARVALERKQTIREGLDEAASQSLELAMRHRATDTVAAILHTMARRKQRRDVWMEEARAEGKYNALAPLDSNELKDLEMLIRLSGLETSVLAEESAADNHGSSKDTSVVMIRMDGIGDTSAPKSGNSSAGKQTLDIDISPANHPTTPAMQPTANGQLPAANYPQPMAPLSPLTDPLAGLEHIPLPAPLSHVPVSKRFALDLLTPTPAMDNSPQPITNADISTDTALSQIGGAIERRREPEDF